MRAYTTNVYTYDELSDKAKQTAIEEYRTKDIFDEWWDTVYEDFKEDMKKYGIEVTNIYFSGFASQGDGAMFEGNISDWDKLSKEINISKGILKLIKEFASYKWKHSGHYYHEYEISFSDGNLQDVSYYMDGHVKNVDREKIEKSLDTIDESLREFIRSQCRDLYKQLEDEYDGMRTDEAIEDTIQANEWEFTQDGKIDNTLN